MPGIVSDHFTLPFYDPSSAPLSDVSIKTVCDLIDFNADQNADQLFCLQAEKSLNGSKTPPFLRITYRSFRDMVFRCQQWIEEHIREIRLPLLIDGRAVKSRPLALLLDSDIGLLVHLFALMGMGVPVLLLSTRLSPTAIHALLIESSACAIIASGRLEGAATEALALYDTNTDFPSVYLQQSYRRFTKPRNAHNNNGNPRREASREGHYVADTDRNVLILHSSGTTGLPKAIPQAHRYLLNLAPYSSFEFDSSWTVEDERTLAFSTLPLYHIYGLLLPMMALSIGKPFAIPPAAFVPSAQSSLEFMASINPGTLYIVPSILQDIVELPEGKGLEALRSLKYVVTGGGPLSSSIGDRIVDSGIALINGYGGTEVGSVGVLQLPGSDRDWRYFRLRKDLGCELKEALIPDQSSGSIHYKMTIRPPGWTEDFEMGDYFITSAKKPNRDFQPTARVDDLIVLKTGEKVPPRILETMLSDRSDVRAAIAFGQGQFEIGALIEPSYPIPEDRVAEYKNAIWHTILDAGKKMDAHARISSLDAVIVLRPGQEFPRSGKGSILRKASYDEFSDDIDKAYALLDNPTDARHNVSGKRLPFSNTEWSTVRADNLPSSPGCNTTPASQEDIDRVINTVVEGMIGPSQPKHGSETSSRRSSRSFEDILSGDIEQTIMKHIQHKIWKSHASPLNKTDDLFELGMDSLQATQLRRYLIDEISKSQFVQAAHLVIPRDFLYTHSSIAKIASYLRGETYSSTSTSEVNVTLDDLMDQYVSTSEPDSLHSGTRATVLITGGTGGLGCHLVAHLASIASVDRVICLNRPSIARSNPYARQFQSNKTKGAAIPLSVIEKVEVIEANTALPLLGLARPVYWGIAASVTHIIHNAWPVDFKRSISSFESQFKIMNNLLDLARDGGAKPRFMFVSSLAVVAQYQYSSTNGPTIVPEEPFSRDWVAPAMGYGQSKLVCEKMLERAVEENVVDGVIARCAQISGATSNGYWNATEYLPTLIRNSKMIGKLPDLQGTFSWLPLEAAATSLVELLLLPVSSDNIFYHIENPVRQSWSSALMPMAKSLGLPLVPFDQWLDRLMSLDSDEVTLSEFFTNDFRHIGLGNLYLDTGRAMKDSPTLRSVGQIGERLVMRYAEHCLRSR